MCARLVYKMLFAFVCAILLAAAPAAQRKPKPVDLPGIAAIRCTDSGDPSADGLCGDGSALNADGSTYDDAEPDVASMLRAADGEFRLSILNDSTPIRSFTIRFPSTRTTGLPFECAGTGCFAGAVENQAFETTVIPASKGDPGQNAGMNTGLIGLTGGLLNMSTGQSVSSTFLIGFPDPYGNAYRWALYYNDSMYPGTSHVTVTRVDGCSWTIEADQNAVAGLMLFKVAKGATGHTYEGRFVMPFRIAFRLTGC